MAAGWGRPPAAVALTLLLSLGASAPGLLPGAPAAASSSSSAASLRPAALRAGEGERGPTGVEQPPPPWSFRLAGPLSPRRSPVPGLSRIPHRAFASFLSGPAPCLALSPWSPPPHPPCLGTSLSPSPSLLLPPWPASLGLPHDPHCAPCSPLSMHFPCPAVSLLDIHLSPPISGCSPLSPHLWPLTLCREGVCC